MWHLLFQDNLGGALGQDAEVATRDVHDGGHGLAHRVEGVDLDEGFLGVVFPHGLVRLAQFHHEAQQGALGLVAQLLGHLAILLRFLQWQ